MWYLIPKTSPDDRLLLPPNRSIQVGRSEGHVTVDDRSVSRKHARLHVQLGPGDSQVDSRVVVKDTSKFGTLINGKRVVGDERELSDGDIIVFGVENATNFVLKREPLVVCCSAVSNATRAQVKEKVASLGGVLVSDWTDECTLLVISKVSVTIKVISALIRGASVVIPEYLDQLASYHAGRQTTAPNPSCFQPIVSGESQHLENIDINLMPRSERRTIFAGCTFIFMTKKRFQRLSSSLELGGAQCLLWEDARPASDETKLVADNTMVFFEDQPSSWAKRVYSVLKKHRRRPVVDAEIGFAVLACSRQDFCNVTKKCDQLLYRHGVTTENLTQNPFDLTSQNPLGLDTSTAVAPTSSNFVSPTSSKSSAPTSSKSSAPTSSKSSATKSPNFVAPTSSNSAAPTSSKSSAPTSSNTAVTASRKATPSVSRAPPSPIAAELPVPGGRQRAIDVKPELGLSTTILVPQTPPAGNLSIRSPPSDTSLTVVPESMEPKLEVIDARSRPRVRRRALPEEVEEGGVEEEDPFDQIRPRSKRRRVEPEREPSKVEERRSTSCANAVEEEAAASSSGAPVAAEAERDCAEIRQEAPEPVREESCGARVMPGILKSSQGRDGGPRERSGTLPTGPDRGGEEQGQESRGPVNVGSRTGRDLDAQWEAGLPRNCAEVVVKPLLRRDRGRVRSPAAEEPGAPNFKMFRKNRSQSGTLARGPKIALVPSEKRTIDMAEVLPMSERAPNSLDSQADRLFEEMRQMPHRRRR